MSVVGVVEAFNERRGDGVVVDETGESFTSTASRFSMGRGRLPWGHWSVRAGVSVTSAAMNLTNFALANAKGEATRRLGADASLRGRTNSA